MTEVQRNTVTYILNLLIMSILLISFMSISGYVFNIEWFYKWGEIPMAINTAIDLFMIGVVLFLMNNYELFFNGRHFKHRG